MKSIGFLDVINFILGSIVLVVILGKVVGAIIGAVMLAGFLIKFGLVLKFLMFMAGLIAAVGAYLFILFASIEGLKWLSLGAFRLLDWFLNTASEGGDWVVDRVVYGCEFVESSVESAFRWLAYTALPKMGDGMTAGWDLIEARVKS